MRWFFGSVNTVRWVAKKRLLIKQRYPSLGSRFGNHSRIMKYNSDTCSYSNNFVRAVDFSLGKYCYVWCDRIVIFMLFSFLTVNIAEYDPYYISIAPNTISLSLHLVVLLSPFLAFLSFVWTLGLMPLRVVIVFDRRKDTLLIRRSFVRKIHREVIDLEGVISLSYSEIWSGRWGNIYLHTTQGRVRLTAFPFSIHSRSNMISAMKHVLKRKNI